MGLDGAKDQSYFLYRVPVSLLERSVFPLGSCRKSEVLEAAAGIGVDVEVSAESQDICFIPGGETQDFIEGRIETVPGEIVDESGRVLGRHGGIHRFTVGQRKGLGVAAGEPLYVSRMDADTGRVVLSGGEGLYSRTVVCSALKMRERRPALPLEARIRYRHPPGPIESIEVSQGRCRVTFREAQRAPAPGQALVIYRGASVMGGGVISEAGAG